jgi:hypothetical protein
MVGAFHYQCSAESLEKIGTLAGVFKPIPIFGGYLDPERKFSRNQVEDPMNKSAMSLLAIVATVLILSAGGVYYSVSANATTDTAQTAGNNRPR